MRKNKLLTTGLLTLGLIFVGNNMAFAEPRGNVNADLDKNSANVDVQAKVNSTDGAVYKVDIEWGEMKFEYTAASVWNPNTHVSSETTEAGWTTTDEFYGTNNEITVTNHSNEKVKVKCEYKKDSAVTGFSGVEGELYTTLDLARTAAETGKAENGSATSEYELATAVGTPINSAPKKTLYFSLRGKPDTKNNVVTDFGKVGSIKLTIADVPEEEEEEEEEVVEGEGQPETFNVE